MKTIQTIILVTVTLACGSVRAAAEKFTSPEGRFRVKIADNNRGEFYEIKDNKSGKIDYSIQVKTSLLWLQWLGDSKAFVSVEHMAGGSFARIVTLRNNGWKCYDILPPDAPMGTYAVINVLIEPKTVQMVYKGGRQQGNGKIIGYYTESFCFDVDSGKISDVKITPVNGKKYLELKPLVGKGLIF